MNRFTGAGSSRDNRMNTVTAADFNPLPPPPSPTTVNEAPDYLLHERWLSYYPLLARRPIKASQFPSWKKPLVVAFLLLPAGLYPLFSFLQSRDFLAAELRGILAVGVSKEVPWILSAVIMTVAAAFLLGLVLGGKGPWREAAGIGSLLALPLFGVLRGFDFSLAISLGAATLTWLGLTIIVVYPFLWSNLRRGSPNKSI